MPKFYFDTSIWIDLYEDRKGYRNEPLGEYAWRLLSIIQARKHSIIITDYLMRELEGRYPSEAIRGMMVLFEKRIEKIILKPDQRKEAKRIAAKRHLPVGDAIHAIIARDYSLILITRDKHFRELQDITEHYRPEDIT